jgi:hypothetical protein
VMAIVALCHDDDERITMGINGAVSRKLPVRAMAGNVSCLG